jgi:hypothetical protein
MNRSVLFESMVIDVDRFVCSHRHTAQRTRKQDPRRRLWCIVSLLLLENSEHFLTGYRCSIHHSIT